MTPAEYLALGDELFAQSERLMLESKRLAREANRLHAEAVVAWAKAEWLTEPDSPASPSLTPSSP